MEVLSRWWNGGPNETFPSPQQNKNENEVKALPQSMSEMGRKQNLQHLSEEECERILSVIQKDFDLRQKEQHRLGQIEEEIAEVNKSCKILGNQKNFNDNCCMRCYSTFFFIFNRKHQCYDCKFNVCKSCCDYSNKEQQYICKVCQRHRELTNQSCDWFYNDVKKKFKRFGSAKVVRSLYKRRQDSSDSENDSGFDLSAFNSLPLARRQRPSVQGLFPQNNLNSSFPRVKNEKNSEVHERVAGGATAPDAQSDASDSEDILKKERQLTCTVPPAVLGNLSYRNFDDALQGAEMERSKLQLQRIIGELQRNLTNHTPLNDPSGTSNAQYDRILMKFRYQLSGVLSNMSQSYHSSNTGLGYSMSEPPMSPNSRHQHLRQMVTKHVEQIIGGQIDMSDETTSEYASEDGSNSDLHKAFEEVMADAIVRKVVEEHRKHQEMRYVQEEEDVKQDLSRLPAQCLDLTENGDSSHHKNQLSGSAEVTYQNETTQQKIPGSDQDSRTCKAGRNKGFEQTDRPSSESELSDIERKAGFKPLCSDVLTSDSDYSNKNSPRCDANLDSSNEIEFAQLAEQYEKVLKGENPMTSSLIQSQRQQHNVTPEQRKELQELADIFNTSQSRRTPVVREVIEEVEVPTSSSSESPVDEVIIKSEVHREDAMMPDLDDSFHGLEFVQNHEVPLPSFLDEPDAGNSSLGLDLDDIRRNTSDEESSSANENSSTNVSFSETWAENNNWFFNDKKIISAYDNFGKKKVGRDMEGPVYMFVPKGQGSPTPQVGEKTVDELSDVSTCSLSEHSDVDDGAVASTELQQITEEIVTAYPVDQKEGTERDNKKGKDEPDDQHLQEKSKEIVNKVVEKAQEIVRRDSVESEETVTEDTEDVDPRFVTRPQNQELLCGETARFDCHVTGSTPTDVFWYRDEDDDITLLEDGDKYEVESSNSRGQLTVHYTVDSDAGRYVCIVVNEVGRCFHNFKLKLKANPMDQTAPEFLKKPQDIEVIAGQSAKFRCKVKGYPLPRVLWYKNGRRLINCEQYRIEKINNRDYTLSLDYVTLEDDAEFMVIAKNNLGEDKATVQLIVEEEQTDTSSKLSSLSGKVTDTRQTVTNTAEDMLQSADQLSEIYRQLDEMNESLSMMEGDVTNLTPEQDVMDTTNNNISADNQKLDTEDILREYEDQKTKAGAVRAVTSTALEVLMSAEDAIQSEKKNSNPEKRKLELPSMTSDYQTPAEVGEEVHLTFQQFEKLYKSGLVTRADLKTRRVVLTKQILAILEDMEEIPDITDHDLMLDGGSPGVMDCGLKRVDSKRYKRDFVINNPGKKPPAKKWEVRTPSPLARPGLATVAPSLGRSGSMEEELMDTEDQIYMTAGKLYSIEDSIKDLESRIQSTHEDTSPEVMSALEDEVARAVAKAELSDKEISALEQQTKKFQTSLKKETSPTKSASRTSNQSNRRSKISSHSSSSSKSNELPELSMSLPELRDSSSEFENSEDMPSVKKLMGMFNQSYTEEDQPFKRVHSLTARSLSKKARDLLRNQSLKNELETPVRIKSPQTIMEHPIERHQTYNVRPISPLAKTPASSKPTARKLAPSPPHSSKTSTPIPKQNILQHRPISPDSKKGRYSPVKTESLSPIPHQSSRSSPTASNSPPTKRSSSEYRYSPVSVLNSGKRTEKPKLRTPPPAEPPPKKSSTIMARAAFWDSKVTSGSQAKMEFPDLPSETFKKGES